MGSTDIIKKNLWRSFTKKHHKTNAPVFLFIKNILLKINVYSEMKMPVRICSWKYESPSALAFHKNRRRKKENESFCLNAFEWELVILAICV